MKKQVISTAPLVLILILAAAVSRLIPHWPNFTPIGAMALFGAAYFPRKVYAVLAPLAALYFSDLLLNNLLYAEYYDGFTWAISSPWVYAGFVLIIGIGWLLRGRVSFWTVGGGAVAASVVFFLLTNFGVWASPLNLLYPKDFTGLLACYTAGLPFFWNTLAGNLFFSGLLFGAYAVLEPRLRLASSMR